MAVLSGFLFVMLALGTDGVPPVMQARRPLPLAEGLPRLPAALGGYKYVLLKLGPFQLTRKGVSLAAAASCLSFTVSSTICLNTSFSVMLSIYNKLGVGRDAEISSVSCFTRLVKGNILMAFNHQLFIIVCLCII